MIDNCTCCCPGLGHLTHCFIIIVSFIPHSQTHPNMFGHHHHHGNGSGDLGKDADTMETTLDSSKANHHHGFDSCCEHSHQTGTTATSSSCKSDSVSTANGNSSSHGNGTGSGTDSNTGDGSGSQKRYCRCCYCELFGPNGVCYLMFHTVCCMCVVV